MPCGAKLRNGFVKPGGLDGSLARSLRAKHSHSFPPQSKRFVVVRRARSYQRCELSSIHSVNWQFVFPSKTCGGTLSEVSSGGQHRQLATVVSPPSTLAPAIFGAAVLMAAQIASDPFTSA
uniref:Uncharacterized protein n=1 Tax=Plectus sambesii TaxID=2011161 RepID=A0A914VZW6_9BILA